MSDLETRQASIGAVEGKTITGYAALYNSWSKPLMGAKGTFTERIAPGAFDASIAAGASLWFMHDSKQILANTKSGTLTLESDDQGLKYTATLGDSQRDAGVLDLVKRGVVSEMSFGFHVPAGGDSWSGDKRTLNSVNLREISIVEQGAYNATTAQVRHLETPVITKVIKPMNIRTMNAKLAELRAQNVEGIESETRADIAAQIEEIIRRVTPRWLPLTASARLRPRSSAPSIAVISATSGAAPTSTATSGWAICAVAVSLKFVQH